MCKLIGKLGKIDDTDIYLEDFEWVADRYWSGGRIRTENTVLHNFSVFYTDQNGLSCNLYEGFKSMIDDSALSDDKILRLCDLFEQFFSYRRAAECFEFGGHYNNVGRVDGEINKDLADVLNKQIENIIIPEVKKLFDDE